MRKFMIVGAVLSLGACAGWQDRLACAKENPEPASMRAGYVFGPIGMLIAYATDGSNIREAQGKQRACVEARKDPFSDPRLATMGEAYGGVPQ